MGSGDPGYASRKAMPKDPGPADSVRIKRAENGYTVSCSHPPKPTKGNQGISWEADKEYVFSDMTGVNAFVKKAFT